MSMQIALLEKHQMFAQMLSDHLESSTSTIHICKDIPHLFKHAVSTSFDFIILEISVATDAEELIKDIKSDFPHSKILIVSAYADHKLVRKMMLAGVDGYISKNNDLKEVKKALSVILEGDVYLGENVKTSPSVKKVTSRDLDQSISDTMEDTYLLRSKLTRREKEILSFLVSGKNNRQIGQTLFISHQTVSVHRKNIMKKLDVNNTSTLIRMAVEKELV